MLGITKKRTAYMVCQQHESGFTFINLLIMLSIIVLVSPFFGYVLKSVEHTSNYEEISIYQFFQFLRDEAIKSSDIYVHNNELVFKQESTLATINLYEDIVRRQVDGMGHEIYLRDIEDIKFTPSPYGVLVRVTNLLGETYEKTIVDYK